MTLIRKFGKLMETHRDGRSLNYVAGKVGCDARTISNMEEGRSVVRLPVYIRLCRVYGLSLAQRAELDEIAAGMAVVKEEPSDG